jgi:hypothetical protein
MAFGFLFLALLFSQDGFAMGKPQATPPPAVANKQTQMTATCYADGASCPGGCDAHAVFKPTHNSSKNQLKNAYFPGTRNDPQSCKPGSDCTICFSPKDDDCVTTAYRGDGPPEGRFDVTPAFMHQFCYEHGSLDLQSDIPAGLRSLCTDVAQGSRQLASKINCIEEPAHPSCKALMDQVIAEKNADLPLYRECLKIGQSAFNKAHPNEQRAYDCAYSQEQSTLQSGTRYRKLLPGACGENSYVSTHGLDCCSADVVQDACSSDCGRFFK